jgi:large subunit ribosomal protein L17
MLANMTISLIEHKRINTTLAKARALRRYAEPLITKSKDNTTHSRRVVFSYLQNKEAITELFGPIASKIADRPGGYLRIIKLGFRRGDGAETAMIEFVDYNELYNIKGDKSADRKKTRRSRRSSGGGAGTEGAAAAATPAAAVVAPEVEAAAETVAFEEVQPVVEAIAEAPAAAAAEISAVADEVADVVAEAPAADDAPAATGEEGSEKEA